MNIPTIDQQQVEENEPTMFAASTQEVELRL
jgi:hypothetical protein